VSRAAYLEFSVSLVLAILTAPAICHYQHDESTSNTFLVPFKRNPLQFTS
jgi:hypothetical protein